MGATLQSRTEMNLGPVGSTPQLVPENWLIWVEMSDRPGFKTVYRVSSELPENGSQRVPHRLIELDEANPIISIWI